MRHVAWFRRADYETARRSMADGAALPRTYDQWLAQMALLRDAARRADVPIEPVVLDVRDFVAWAAAEDVRPDAAARDRYANLKRSGWQSHARWLARSAVTSLDADTLHNVTRTITAADQRSEPRVPIETLRASDADAVRAAATMLGLAPGTVCDVMDTLAAAYARMPHGEKARADFVASLRARAANARSRFAED